MSRTVRTAFVALSLAVASAAAWGCDRAKPMVGEVPVAGMTCESCTQALTHRLGEIEGVERCDVDLASATATVNYDGAKVAPSDLVEAIEAVGYEAGEPVVRPAS